MTPDVAHAWLMSNLKVLGIRSFLGNIKFLILDEAHIYEGVFGTNMACFLRRLQAASKPQRIFTSRRYIRMNHSQNTIINAC